jgi:thymidine phosphorylase
MQKIEDSRGLAKSLVEVANGTGLRTSALITDMNEPLATAAGNAVEVLNAVEFLTGAHIDRRLWEVTVALGGELLALGGLANDNADGRGKIVTAFRSGKAAELFGKMTAALGGPADFMERPTKYLKAAPVIRDVMPDQAGTVAAIDTRAIGIAVVELGGGRMRAADPIDHSVGFTALAGLGAKSDPKTPLARVHAKDAASADRAAASLRAAYTIGEKSAPAGRVVYERIGP